MGTAATQVIKSRPADQKIFQNRKKVKDTEYPVGALSLTFFLFWIDYFSFNRDGFLLFRNEIQFWLLTKLILRYFCHFAKRIFIKAHLHISPKTRNVCALRGDCIRIQTTKFYAWISLKFFGKEIYHRTIKNRFYPP